MKRKDEIAIKVPATVHIAGVTAETVSDVIVQMMKTGDTEQILENGFLLAYGKLDDEKKEMLLTSVLLTAYLNGDADAVPIITESIAEVVSGMKK